MTSSHFIIQRLFWTFGGTSNPLVDVQVELIWYAECLSASFSFLYFYLLSRTFSLSLRSPLNLSPLSLALFLSLFCLSLMTTPPLAFPCPIFSHPLVYFRYNRDSTHPDHGGRGHHSGSASPCHVDLNHDNLDDMVFIHRDAQVTALQQTNGSYVVVEYVKRGVTEYFHAMHCQAGDLNGDGHIDVFFSGGSLFAGDDTLESMFHWKRQDSLLLVVDLCFLPIFA